MVALSNNHNMYRVFAETGITASYNESIEELLRGIRTHFSKIMKKVSEDDVKKA